jgi:transcriptional regulator with XRE-family HTH domain
MKYFFQESILIRALRKLYGYSQEEFCVLLGYSQSALSKIENGIISPDIKFVIALSQKINIDLNLFKYGLISKIPDYLQNNKETSFLQHAYLKDGVFSSKTTYFLLEMIHEELEVDIYKKLKLAKEYMVFSELKYNLKLFIDLLDYVEPQKVISLMKKFTQTSNALLSEEAFKACILNLKIVKIASIVKSGKVFEVELNYSKSFDYVESSKDVSSYLQQLIAFNILNELNINVDLVSTKKTNKVDMTLKLYAS